MDRDQKKELKPWTGIKVKNRDHGLGSRYVKNRGHGLGSK